MNKTKQIDLIFQTHTIKNSQLLTNENNDL